MIDEKKNEKIKKLKEILTENPKLTALEIQEQMKKITGERVDYSYIAEVRDELGLPKAPRSKSAQTLSSIGLKLVDVCRDALKNNPNATNMELRNFAEKATGISIGYPLSGGMVKRLRMELRGEPVPSVKSKGNKKSKKVIKSLRDAIVDEAVEKQPMAPRPYRRKSSNLYMVIWTHPVTEGTSKTSRELLVSFINELNSTGRSRFEIVERLNPNVLEVREQGPA